MEARVYGSERGSHSVSSQVRRKRDDQDGRQPGTRMDRWSSVATASMGLALGESREWRLREGRRVGVLRGVPAGDRRPKPTPAGAPSAGPIRRSPTLSWRCRRGRPEQSAAARSSSRSTCGPAAVVLRPRDHRSPSVSSIWGNAHGERIVVVVPRPANSSGRGCRRRRFVRGVAALPRLAISAC